MADGFQWAERNLEVTSPDQLQREKVGVHLAPNLPAGERLVRLTDGRVDVPQPGEHVPHDEVYYAEIDSLAEYCREHGLELQETEGFASVQPRAERRAG